VVGIFSSRGAEQYTMLVTATDPDLKKKVDPDPYYMRI
jgi:hypothetical protein